MSSNLHRRRSRFASWASGAIAVAALLVAAPGTASALDATCIGSARDSFSPGLLNVPRTVTVGLSGQAGCVSLTDPLLRGVSFSSSITAMSSCSDLLLSGTATKTLVWDSGARSTFSYNFSANYVAGQLIVTETGVITAGTFAGASAIGVNTLLGDLTRCAVAPGLERLDGAYRLTIL